MSESIEYRKMAELKILKLFDAAVLLDEDVNLDLISLDIQYIYCSIIEKLSEETVRKFVRFSINLIKYSHKSVVNYIKFREENEESIIQVKKVSTILSKFIQAIVGLTEKSLDFCNKFHEEENRNGIKVLLDLITDDIILSFLKKSKDTELKDNLKDCFLILFNLTRVYDVYRDKWGEMNAFKILLDLIDKLDDEENKLRTIMIISNIASDDDLNIVSINSFDSLSNELERFARALADENFFNDHCFSRELIQIEIGQPKHEVIHETGKNLIQYLKTLYNFLINDKIKNLFYETLKVKNSIKKIIYNGNDIEKEYAVMVLNRFCFDKNIVYDLRNDKNISSFMTSLVKKKKDTHKNLVKNLKAILWLLLNDEPTHIVSKNTGDEITKPIYISHHQENKSVALRIKKYLETSGQKCLVNEENDQLEFLDEMSKCINESSCVLFCVNKKYKNCSYCRIEINYVLQVKKRYIPIIIEKSFKSDGW
jgi:hypothetical protein